MSTNRYYFNLNDPVNATGDGNAITGITGDRWKDNNTLTTVLSDGRTLAAGDSLLYGGAIVQRLTNTSIDKIVSLKIPANSLSDTTNTAIKVALSDLEFSSNVTIFGILPMGYQSEANGLGKYQVIYEVKTITGSANGELSPDFTRFVVDGDNLMIFLSKNYFPQIVRESAVILNLLIKYR
jgi:hypothetical protein